MIKPTECPDCGSINVRETASDNDADYYDCMDCGIDFAVDLRDVFEAAFDV